MGWDNWCNVWCLKRAINAEKLIKLEQMYEKLQGSKSKSLLKKHLKRSIYNVLKFRRSFKGTTLLECIQSGLENYDAKIGAYASEPECYKFFAEMFDPIIQEYHMGFLKTDLHPFPNWGDVESIDNIDPDGKYIEHVQLSCSRNISGFDFHPLLDKSDYRNIRKKVLSALKRLPKELRGGYYSLKLMTDKELKDLQTDNLLFDTNNPHLRSANAYNHWPTGRGIFYNDDLDFAVWVNGEDHIRVLSFEGNGNIGNAYRRLYKGLNSLEKHLNFCRSRRLGYITFSPRILGTAMEVTVHMKICHLIFDKMLFKSIADKYKLEVKLLKGKHPKGVCYYQVSNRCSLGITEYQIVQQLCLGINEIIQAENEQQMKQTETATDNTTENLD